MDEPPVETLSLQGLILEYIFCLWGHHDGCECGVLS